MEMNQMKIVCNPYSKHMDYYWMEENGSWSDLSKSDKSPLNADKYTNTSIAKSAYPLLLELIDYYYNKTVGLKIIFEGTKDDFDVFEMIRNSYFMDYNIELVMGNKKMRDAKEVMANVEGVFKEVEAFFKEYPDPNTEKIISKYRDAVRPEVALCVMGLYSSGKSAFINSLIGRELLPSNSDPATAKVYKIEDNKDFSIKFEFQQNEYIIEYSNNTWKASKSFDSEIMNSIKESIEEHDCRNEEQLMYYTLLALNQYAKQENDRQHNELIKCAKELLQLEDTNDESDDRYIEKLLKKYRIKELVEKGKMQPNKLGPVIYVSTSFVVSNMPTDKFKFVIYDTPGSNSVQFREHADILKDSLEQQTNGLPIFVTTPDSMDEKDNKEIMDIIEELGGALDVSNMMLIVNKADEKAPETLEEKARNKDNLVLTKWKTSRVYFVSSIIALGAKKPNPTKKGAWIHPDYRTTYKGKINQFSDEEDEDYLSLYMYNILPENDKQRILKKASEIDEEQILAWNSGIPCVEEEIGIFAEKDALYNKCNQAIGYLSSAISSVGADIEIASKKAEETRGKIENQIEVNKKELIHQLKSKCSERVTIFQQNFAEQTTKNIVVKYLDEKRIQKIVDEAYSKSKGKNDHEKLQPFNDEIESRLRKDTTDYAKEATEKIQNYWKDCARQLREELTKIVVDNDSLTQKEKTILRDVVNKVIQTSNNHIRLDIKNNTDVVVGDFKLFWLIWMTTIDKEQAVSKYKDALNKDITVNNKTAATENEKEFRRWTEALINRLDSVIASFNPNLKKLEDDLKKQVKIVERKNNQKKFIESALAQINQLIRFEEV